MNSQSEIITLIEFVIDASGSMGAIKNAAIRGYNNFVTEQKNSTDTCLLTLTKFDTAGGIQTPFVDLDIHSVIPMTDQTFVPGGGTNLRDAIVQRAYAISQRIKNFSSPVRATLVVLTDGEDTSSQFSVQQTKEMLLDYQKQDFTFVFMGSTPNSIQTALSLGFPLGNSCKFEIDQIETAMHTVSVATTAYRTSNATGSNANYFSFGEDTHVSQ